MARSHFRDALVGKVGSSLAVLANATVIVANPGTEDPIAATLYADESSGATLPNPLTTGPDGGLDLWLAATAVVDLVITSAAGFASPGNHKVIPKVGVGPIATEIVDRGSVQSITGQKTLASPILNTPEINSPTLNTPTITGQVLLPAGSSGAPAIAKTGDTNTGPYWPAADTYAIQVGASEAIRMRLGSKFAQVGIGNVGEPGPGGQSNIFHVHFSNSSASFGDVVGAAIEITNESNSGGAGSVPDSSAISAYHYVTAATGDLSSRALEAQVIVGHASANPSANSTSQAIEAAIHTLAAGDGTRKTGVIHLGSYDAAGFAGGVAADYALRIWGARGYIRGIIQEDTAGNLIFHTNGSDGSVTTAGHVSMTGTGKRVIIDGNNATIANRTFVQTKNANSPTYLGVVPNGTSLISGVMVANEQGLTNFSYGLLEVTNGVVRLNTAKAGSGSVVPMELQYDGTKRIELNSTGLGIFGVSPVARAAAMTQTYSTADRTLSAYTSNAQGTTFGGINNAQAGNVYAQVSNLESLRVAYENLRAFTEDVAQFLNAWIDSEQAYGWAQ
jgi:hypothetical protein